MKIYEVEPINFDLKSRLEKLAILEAYKNFLNNSNFNIQILIKTQKENLEKIYSKLNESQFFNYSNNSEINENILNLKNSYINHLQYLNDNFNITNKKYYLIISIDIIDNNIKLNKSKNDSTIISFFNFTKKLILKKDINSKLDSNTISNYNSNNEIPYKVLEEFKDINSIIYNTLTRACTEIRPLNNIEIISLLKESFNFNEH